MFQSVSVKLALILMLHLMSRMFRSSKAETWSLFAKQAWRVALVPCSVNVWFWNDVPIILSLKILKSTLRIHFQAMKYMHPIQLLAREKTLTKAWMLDYITFWRTKFQNLLGEMEESDTSRCDWPKLVKETEMFVLTLDVVLKELNFRDNFWW